MSASALAVGDVNRDGVLDVAFADGSDRNIGVWLGNADGTFGQGIFYFASNDPVAIVLKDLNRDGILDMAVADAGSNIVSIFIGNSNGIFGARADFAVGVTPTGLVAGDFNNDGIIDLATCNSGDGSVSVLLGNGDGTFRRALNSDADPDPNSITAADFNGDGKLDLAVTNGTSNQTSILFGNRDGTFQTPVHYDAGVAPQAIVAGDLNGDHQADLVVLDQNSSAVQIRFGQGNGTFGPATTISAGLNPRSAVIADLNGDGNSDIAVANTDSNDVSVFLGIGNGAFETPVNYVVGTDPMCLGVGDFNQDGKQDIITGNASSRDASALLNLENGFFAGSIDYPAGVSPEESVPVDVNHDGILDLVVTNPTSNELSVLLGNGDGSFQPPVAYSTGIGSAPEGLTAVDLNGDGFMDIVVADAGTNDVSVFLGNANGTLAHALHFAAGSHPTSIASGDFTGDHHPDLVVADAESNAISVLVGNGDGTFAAPVSYGAPTNPNSVSVADFNRDGNLDIAVFSSANGNVRILPGRGDGTFGAPIDSSFGSALAICVGDFNNDMIPDLIVSDVSYGASLWRGNGDGTFSNAGFFETYPRPICVNSGYFLGDDNLLDVVSANALGSDVSIRRGYGGAIEYDGPEYKAGRDPRWVSVGDFNNDGLLDLATTNPDSGLVTIILSGVTRPPDRLQNSVPASTTAGTSFTVTVTALDSSGMVDQSLNGGLQIYCSDGQATIPSTSTLSHGIGSFTAILGTAGVQQVLVRGPGGIEAVSNILVNAGQASQFRLDSPQNAVAGSPFDLTVSAIDSFGNVDLHYSGRLHFASDDPLAVLPPNSTLSEGVGTFSATLKTAESSTVTVQDTAKSAIDGSTRIQIEATAASRFEIDTLSSTIAGAALNITVTALDPFGNTATGYTGTLHFGSSDPDATLPMDALLVAGVKEFATRLVTAGTQTISASDTSDSSVSGVSADIVVAPAPATHLRLDSPVSATAGNVLSLTVTALDPFGNVAAGYSGAVHFTSSDSQATLSPDYTFSGSDGGLHSFSFILRMAGVQTVVATDAATSSITGNQSITVASAAASRFVLSGPAEITSGSALSFAVTAEDPFANVATNYAGTVHFTSSDMAAVLPANYTFTTNDHGTHSFSATFQASGNQTVAVLDAAGSSITGTLAITVHSSDPFVPYMRYLYETVLNRVPASSELTPWVAFLDQGGSRTVVSQLFWESAEHRRIQVDSFYLNYLGRPADPAGRAGWVAAMLVGMTESQVIQAFLASPEFQHLHAGDASFVTAIYVEALGRTELSAELTGWLQFLNNGGTRGQFVQLVLTSMERYRRVVEDYYSALLQRAPDATGESEWVSMLLSGAGTSEKVAEGILASDEYFAISQRSR
jgi:hypothetical protein